MIAAPPLKPAEAVSRRLAKSLALFAVAVATTAGLATIGASALSAPTVSNGSTAASQTAAPVTDARAPLHVAVVGDSLIATTTPDQHAELASRGYDASVNGNPGKPLTDPWIQARLGESGHADIVVIATASNDNVQLANRADEVGTAQASNEYAQTLANAVDRVAAPCTVVVDVREQTSPVYRPETAPITNASLRTVAGASSHPTVVVAWSMQSAGHDHTDWFVDDELHFITNGQRQDAGVQAYVRAIANGVDQCKAILTK